MPAVSSARKNWPPRKLHPFMNPAALCARGFSLEVHELYERQTRNPQKDIRMTTQETTKTPADLAALTAAFSLETKSSFHLSASDFEDGTLAVYGKRIEVIESANDTTHEFTGVDGAELDRWDQASLNEAIKDGAIEAYKAGVVLNDLVKRGVLTAGDYYIRVSW